MNFIVPILFENDDVVVVNKPEGLACIPERAKEKENVLSLLSAQTSRKLYVVHRLDKEVSGVLLFAKNPEIHKFLSVAFEKRSVRKTYVALVQGVMEGEGGVIDKPIRAFGSGRMGVDLKTGKGSITRYHVTHRYKVYTLLSVHPVTGRRHQIRVHLYSVGHSVVGDPRYGNILHQKKFPRLMLHAKEIALDLPSGERLKVECPLPESFMSTIKLITPT